MSWADTEDAIHAAIVEAARLPATQVRWKHQNFDWEDNPCVVLSLGGDITIGIDRIKYTQDLSRPNGQEIRQQVSGLREVALEIECYSDSVTGNITARRLCELIRTRMRLPSVRYGMRAVGVTPFDPGPVEWVPDIIAAGFEGRAICSVRCYMPAQDMDEYCGYIGRVQGTVYAFGGGVPTGQTHVIYFDSSGATGL